MDTLEAGGLPFPPNWKLTQRIPVRAFAAPHRLHCLLLLTSSGRLSLTSVVALVVCAVWWCDSVVVAVWGFRAACICCEWCSTTPNSSNVSHRGVRGKSRSTGCRQRCMELNVVCGVWCG
jgi:hypothetical protein